METNLPPVRHSSTTLPTSGGSERRRGGGVFAVLGAGVLLVLVSFTVAYLLLGLYGPAGQRTAASPSTPATAPGATPAAVPQALPTPEESRLLTPAGVATESPALPTGPFALRNAVTGSCLWQVGGRVAQRTCKAGEKQWKLEKTRTIDGVDLYRIRRATGAARCLDVPFSDVQPEGVVLGVFGCVSPAGGDNQEFRIQARETGGLSGFTLMNHKNQLCVDVSGRAGDRSDRGDGRDLTLYRCEDEVDGYDDHLWTFS